MARQISGFLAVLWLCLQSAALVGAQGSIPYLLNMCEHCPPECIPHQAPPDLGDMFCGFACPGWPVKLPVDLPDFYYANTGLTTYIKHTKALLDECGSENWDLYRRAAIYIKQICGDFTAEYYDQLATVRVTFPCFGNPTKTPEGALSYPQYGTWKVLNLYFNWIVTFEGNFTLYDAMTF